MDPIDDAMRLSYELGELRTCECGSTKIQGRKIPGGAPFFEVRCGKCFRKTEALGTESSAVAAWNQNDLAKPHPSDPVDPSLTHWHGPEEVPTNQNCSVLLDIGTGFIPWRVNTIHNQIWTRVKRWMYIPE